MTMTPLLRSAPICCCEPATGPGRLAGNCAPIRQARLRDGAFFSTAGCRRTRRNADNLASAGRARPQDQASVVDSRMVDHRLTGLDHGLGA
jgi:hypothetical protein